MRRVFMFCLFLIIILNSKNLKAQTKTYKEVSITTPNAASLTKYADVPVNNHTGIPQISIPLHTVQEGDLKLPIDLSYHSGGLKVLEPASWVGAGWSLNAGGVITRTVRGTPDERWTSTSNAEQMKGYLSDNGYPNYLWQDNPGGSNTFLKEIAFGNSDGEPDLFFFNFSGYSGKFYFGDDKVPVVIPEQDIKIEYVYSPGIFKSIESFILTTADGVKFFFGMTPSTSDVDPVERILPVSVVSGYGHDGKSISSWFLNKVQSNDALKEIILTYEAESFGYHTISQPSLTYDFYSTNQSGGVLTKMLVDGVRLSKIITSNNNVVDFIPGQIREDLSGRLSETGDDANEQAKSLGEIRITDYNTLCKKLILNYGYFVDNSSSMPNCGPVTTERDRKRLKLLNIQETACDGSVSVPPYQFEYFSEPVPRRISFSQDHWGFVNGVNNLVLIPTIYQNGFYERPGADRDSKWPAMRAGTLNKISYPTGGATEFEFEPNKTWVSYNKYTEESAFITSVGYDGGYSSTTYQYFENLNYKVVLSNSPCQYGYTECGAWVSIYDVNNNLVGGTYSAEGGQSQTNYFYIPSAGVYRIAMSKSNPASGFGASANFKKLSPLLYQANEMVGGLRIKSIKTIEPLQNPQPTNVEYTYDVNGISSGILYSRPTYVVAIKNSGARYAYQTLFFNGATQYLDAEISIPEEYPYFVVGPAKTALMSAGAILPMQTTQGNHIGYNEVKVSKINNGYSIFRYYGSNLWDLDHSDVAFRRYNTARSSSDPEYPAAPIPFEPKRGELKYEGHFNQAAKLLKESTYTPIYTESPVTTPGVIVHTDIRTGPLTLYLSAKTDYELRSYKKTEVTIVSNEYDDFTNNYLSNTSTVKFESLFHNQQTSRLSINSKGQTTKELIKFAFDFVAPSCSQENTCWIDYQAALQNNLTLYGQEYNSCTTDDCRRIARANFNSRNMASRRDYSSCRKNSIASYNSCFQSAKSTANAELKPIFELRDKHINAPLEISQWKNNQLLSSTFTKYGYVVNSVYPEKIEKINLATPSSSFTNSYVSGNSLIRDTRYEEEAALKMTNGTISEITGKDGITTSYIWGYNNTLPIAKVAGVDYVTLLAAYNAVSGNLSQLRTHTSLSGAFVSTYTYTPGVGMTSETDPRGRTTYYEYDKLNRLVLVKDHESKILKKICYNYAGQPENCLSPCTNTTAEWQNTTTALRCQLNAGQNTGYQEQEQRDMNPCSPTYNQLRWVQTVYNTTACPLPAACNSGNCSGNDKKCINGVCETGVWVVISATRETKTSPWTCVWAYCFSDGSTSTYTQTTTSSTMCAIGCY